MRRIAWLILAGFLPILAAPPAHAGDTEALRDEIQGLKRQTDALESQRELLLRREIESYLRHSTTASAQGDDNLRGITLKADFVATFLATVNADPSNTHAARGVVRLDFDFELTDNLSFFLDVSAETAGGLPAGFGATGGAAGATLSGLFDGIGVDGTVTTAPGSARVYETGVHWVVPVSDRTLYVLFGKLDPRNHYAQNAFAQDGKTQFLNNLFNDPPALNWPTTAAGPTILGLEVWMHFGSRNQYRFNTGWYNGPGQWFEDGIWLFQFTWATKLRDRETNVRVYGQVDTLPSSVSSAVGVSWDWWVTDRIGVFARATIKDNQGTSTGETNHVESDWQGGAFVRGPIPNRPDDHLGVAVGHIKGPIRAAVAGAPENSETVIELYYTYMAEDGKLQITGLLQWILDPGAGTVADGDTLVLLGLRIYVPF